MAIINKILKTPLNKTSFAVVDLETTGFSYKTQKVIEIAAVKIKNGEILDTFESLIYTDYIPEYVTKYVHGIDTLMVKDAPPLHVVRPRFCEFVDGCVLVGHNIKRFDSNFLSNDFKLNKNIYYVDTIDISKALFQNERHHSLDAVTERLGIKRDVRHRALADVEATVKVFIKFLKLSSRKYKILEDII
jgi:DNA polymerase-3 subunit alpha (Gram-positive type)